MYFLDRFSPQALHHAVRSARNDAPHPGTAVGQRLCGRCLALALLHGEEVRRRVELPDQVLCGGLTMDLFAELYLRLLRAAGDDRAWRDVDLGALTGDLTTFVGWVALTEPRAVLERIEHRALVRLGHG